jgi:hypothetical protein
VITAIPTVSQESVPGTVPGTQGQGGARLSADAAALWGDGLGWQKWGRVALSTRVPSRNESATAPGSADAAAHLEVAVWSTVVQTLPTTPTQPTQSIAGSTPMSLTQRPVAPVDAAGAGDGDGIVGARAGAGDLGSSVQFSLF